MGGVSAERCRSGSGDRSLQWSSSSSYPRGGAAGAEEAWTEPCSLLIPSLLTNNALSIPVMKATIGSLSLPEAPTLTGPHSRRDGGSAALRQ